MTGRFVERRATHSEATQPTVIDVDSMSDQIIFKASIAGTYQVYGVTDVTLLFTNPQKFRYLLRMALLNKRPLVWTKE